jgi:predicted kinase
VPESLVLVTGPPGAGKSTIAPALAAGLDMPLVSKDAVKEAIHDGFGRRALTLEESQSLGAAAFEVMWAIARDASRIVLEANFHRGNGRQMHELRTLRARTVEVFCRCDPDIASARYRDRHRRGERHPVHVMETIPPEVMRMFQPLQLGPVIEVDTTAAVDVDGVVTQLKALLADGAQLR